MDVHLHHALGPVKVHLTDTAARAEKRRLRYREKVTCRPRCTGCCSRLVTVSMAEALIMYEHLKAGGRWPDVRRRAGEQLRLLGAVRSMVWFKMRQKCPVLNLETGLCLAHPVRPAACSTHFATSKPELCDPWSTEPGQFKSLDFADLFGRFQQLMAESVQDHGVFTLMLPIPSAIVLAEKVSVKSGLDLSEVVSLFFKEL